MKVRVCIQVKEWQNHASDAVPGATLRLDIPLSYRPRYNIVGIEPSVSAISGVWEEERHGALRLAAGLGKYLFPKHASGSPRSSWNVVLTWLV